MGLSKRKGEECVSLRSRQANLGLPKRKKYYFPVPPSNSPFEWGKRHSSCPTHIIPLIHPKKKKTSILIFF